MTAPRATMRLQFHRGFTLDDAVALAPYMAALGVSHLYASPILTARPGSLHGYDVTDPTQVNPELGGEAALRRLVAALRAQQLGLIVDIVPNHMAVSADNPWWWDVLENGRSSRYADFFDIDWQPVAADLRDKVLLPVLGQPCRSALAAGELSITHDDAHGKPVLRYFDNSFPLSRETAASYADARNSYDASTEAGRAKIDDLVRRQHYRLAWWRVAGDEINWRRFFDINDLVGVRAELEKIFDATHATLFRLYAEGLIDGVRVDHIDGLTDPGGYCRRLRAGLEGLTSRRPAHAPLGQPYIVVEKILAPAETMPDTWPVDGTTGYDFLDAVNAVQHDAAGRRPLISAWHDMSGRTADFEVEALAARREIIDRSFSSQLDALVSALYTIAQDDAEVSDLSRMALRRAVVALLLHFPTYRAYDGDAAAADVWHRALEGARKDLRGAAVVADVVAGWLSAPSGAAQQAASVRFQQLTAPLAAKAIEDTAFYRYGVLLSRNDVGCDVEQFASDAKAFHANCAARASTFPHAMLATATHDHKRGEDLRARLAVLSEMPEAWITRLRRWRDMNASLRHRSENSEAPSAGDEVMLYQMIVAAWPVTLSADDEAGLGELAERLLGWQEKAMREAKLATDWSDPNPIYEDGAKAFLRAVLAQDSPCLPELAELARQIGPAGAVNGLAQVALKLTVPGVPDIFQGTEYWDQSLVDPDNRRSVDWDARQRTLRETESVPELMRSWRDGRVKQGLIARVLGLRTRRYDCFASGTYQPLRGAGPKGDHLIAFARQHASGAVVVIAPRLPLALLGSGDGLRIDADVWQDTRLELPDRLGDLPLRDVLTGVLHAPFGRSLPVAQVLAECPIAVLTDQ